MFCKRIKFKLLHTLISLDLILFLLPCFPDNIVYGQREVIARILQAFPSPGPSPQDLAWDGDHIWVADDITDTIYKLNPLDGSLLSSVPSPGPKPRGLTWDGSYLWCSDSDSIKIFKMDPSNGNIIASIPAPVSVSASDSSDQVRGLTWDDQYLWSAYYAGWSSMVKQIDPENGSVFASFFNVVEGLAFDGQHVWAVSYTGGYTEGTIDQLTLPEGHLIAYFRTPGKYPMGLAFDGKYFWHSDHAQNTIYTISLKGDVNGDEIVNIIDVIRCINIILMIGAPPTEYELWSADYNWDGEINVLDATGMVNEILMDYSIFK